MIKRVVAVGLSTIVHYAITMSVLLHNMGTVTRDFDKDRQPPATLVDRAIEVLQSALSFPLVDPLGDLWPTVIRSGAFPLQHVPFVVNAILWAVTLVAVIRLWRRRAA